jgi:hypothetical protein
MFADEGTEAEAKAEAEEGEEVGWGRRGEERREREGEKTGDRRGKEWCKCTSGVVRCMYVCTRTKWEKQNALDGDAGVYVWVGVGGVRARRKKMKWK